MFMQKPQTACAGCRGGEGFELEIAMAFQPIVDAVEQRVHAYEALVRGADGSGAADVLAQVSAENRYAFDQKCRVAAIEGAVAAGILDGPARLSINFMPNAVYSPTACIQLTLATAMATGFPTDRLTFEFSETEKMLDPGHVSRIMTAYREMGFSTAIDDFGAGHSGLNLLARIRPDSVKFDRGLIHRLDSSSWQQTLVASLVRMCRDIGVDIVAEGVETQAEFDLLREMGVRYFQGYLFAKPVSRKLPPVSWAPLRPAH